MTQSPDWKERTMSEKLQARSLVLSLTANDVQESLAWYCDVVGFELDQRFEHDGELRGAALKAGDVQIMLSQEDGALGRDRQKGQGLRVYLNTAQDVDAVAAAIRSRGGTLASEPEDMPWGARAFSLVDPNGFKLTISAEVEEPS